MSTEDEALELRVQPLGGCGEMGMNCTVLALGDEAIVVDCGVQFGGINTPVIDRLIPDFSPLESLDVKALVLTHGHLDHIGAVPAFLRERKVPVYGPPFALELLRSRLEEEGISRADLHEVKIGERRDIAPFDVEWVRITHSIPDNALLAIRTPAGTVVHSGDFKIDPDPIDGRPTDVARLEQIGDEGVDLLLSDSTNSERSGRNLEERRIGQELEEIVRETEGCAVVATFSSHVDRLQSIVRAATLSGRRIALVGRSIQRVWSIATARGLIDADASSVIDVRRMTSVPRGRLLVVVSGTQGEYRAGLWRLTHAQVYGFSLRAGDRVVLSARTIPGNELSVRRMTNRLIRNGVQVVRDRDRPVHCSGHATRDEQIDLIRWLRPRAFVPVHGDRAMLEAHAKTALAEGIDADQILVIEDGDSVLLSKDGLRFGPHASVERRAMDEQGRHLPWSMVSELQEVAASGVVFCSVALGPDHQPTGPASFSGIGVSLSEDLLVSLRRLVAEVCRTDRSEDLDRHLERSIAGFLGGRGRRRPRIVVHSITPAP